MGPETDLIRVATKVFCLFGSMLESRAQFLLKWVANRVGFLPRWACAALMGQQGFRRVFYYLARHCWQVASHR
jgi:hypothetical protein